MYAGDSEAFNHSRADLNELSPWTFSSLCMWFSISYKLSSSRTMNNFDFTFHNFLQKLQEISIDAQIWQSYPQSGGLGWNRHRNGEKKTNKPITLATTFYFKSLLELLTQLLHGAAVALRSDDILLCQAQVVKFLPAATECTLSLIVVLPACLVSAQSWPWSPNSFGFQIKFLSVSL